MVHVLRFTLTLLTSSKNIYLVVVGDILSSGQSYPGSDFVQNYCKTDVLSFKTAAALAALLLFII